jgi:carbonic anhydrase
MTTLDTLIERNQDFASHHFPKDLPLLPRFRAMIIGCVDPRVDPALLLGLGLGEAVVIRNVGGRITPGTLQTMGMLNRVAQVGGGNPAGEFHLIVLQHTQCGITRLDQDPDMLASYFGIGKEGLLAKAVDSPHAAVAVDVVVPPAPLASPESNE